MLKFLFPICRYKVKLFIVPVNCAAAFKQVTNRSTGNAILAALHTIAFAQKSGIENAQATAIVFAVAFGANHFKIGYGAKQTRSLLGAQHSLGVLWCHNGRNQQNKQHRDSHFQESHGLVLENGIVGKANLKDNTKIPKCIYSAFWLIVFQKKLLIKKRNKRCVRTNIVIGFFLEIIKIFFPKNRKFDFFEFPSIPQIFPASKNIKRCDFRGLFIKNWK